MRRATAAIAGAESANRNADTVESQSLLDQRTFRAAGERVYSGNATGRGQVIDMPVALLPPPGMTADPGRDAAGPIGAAAIEIGARHECDLAPAQLKRQPAGEPDNQRIGTRYGRNVAEAETAGLGHDGPIEDGQNIRAGICRLSVSPNYLGHRVNNCRRQECQGDLPIPIKRHQKRRQHQEPHGDGAQILTTFRLQAVRT